jgi:hypothetical protein
MPRARTGSLIKRKDGFYSAKITALDGSRPTIDLGTRVRAIAVRRLAERVTVAGPAPAKRPSETFERAASRVNDQREAEGVIGTADEWTRLKKWALPSSVTCRSSTWSPLT